MTVAITIKYNWIANPGKYGSEDEELLKIAALDKGKEIGFGIFGRPPDQVDEGVLWIEVLPQYRSQGIGNKIRNKALKILQLTEFSDTGTTDLGKRYKGASKFALSFVTKVQASYIIIAEEPKVWYHGRNVKNQTFDPKYTGKGNDQAGPGFYFSSSKDDARGYAYPHGIIMTVQLHPKKLVTGKANRKEIQRLIEAAPHLMDTLTNWHENPEVALRQAIDGTVKFNESAQDAFQQVWIDFYRYEPEKYLKGMMTLGYDGHQIDKKHGGADHLVIYNPKVLEVEDYGS